MGSLADDQDVFLLIAEHCQQEAARRRSFANASPALRAKKVFMMKVVAHDASLFGLASAALQQDFDLALLAFAAQDPAVVGAYLNERHYPNQRHFVERFHRQVQDMLGVHEAFWTLLCGMLPDSGSALTVLNQGLETSLGYKQLIAALLDVQTGKKLRLLRRAYTNLEESRYLSDEDDDSENEDAKEEGSEDLEGEDSDEEGSEDLESEDFEEEGFEDLEGGDSDDEGSDYLESEDFEEEGSEDLEGGDSDDEGSDYLESEDSEEEGSEDLEGEDSDEEGSEDLESEDSEDGEV